MNLIRIAMHVTASGCLRRFRESHTVLMERATCLAISLDDAWSSYYSYAQGGQQSLNGYLKDYQSLVQVLEHYGAAIGANGPFIKSVRDQVRLKAGPGLTMEEYKEKEITAARQQSVAIGFLKRVDRRRYGGLWSGLDNSYSRGQDQYPTDLTGAYNLLLNYKAAPIQ